MILPLVSLKKTDFNINSISCIYQTPKYKTLSPHSRTVNGFICIDKGTCTYNWNDTSCNLTPGSLIYLPKGSNHRLDITSDSISFFRVDFSVKINDENVYFSETPQLLSEHISPYVTEILRKLEKNSISERNYILRKSLLCNLFLSLIPDSDQVVHKKIKPAVSWLYDHYTESVSTAYLAELCALSVPQLYRLFQSEYGTTPFKYRDNLLIHHAKLLLKGHEIPVSEISETLGFESVSYFSYFFKKNTGILPSEY